MTKRMSARLERTRIVRWLREMNYAAAGRK